MFKQNISSNYFSWEFNKSKFSPKRVAAELSLIFVYPFICFTENYVLFDCIAPAIGLNNNR